MMRVYASTHIFQLPGYYTFTASFSGFVLIMFGGFQFTVSPLCIRRRGLIFLPVRVNTLSEKAKILEYCGTSSDLRRTTYLSIGCLAENAWYSYMNSRGQGHIWFWWRENESRAYYSLMAAPCIKGYRNTDWTDEGRSGGHVKWQTDPTIWSSSSSTTPSTTDVPRSAAWKQ